MTLIVKDGQGSDRYMDVTGEGSASNPFQYKITSIDMLFACSLGKIENYSFVDKFGEKPDIIPARTDIKLTVESSSNDNVGVFGTFDILLVDESEFSSAYLTAIGQP